MPNCPRCEASTNNLARLQQHALHSGCPGPRAGIAAPPAIIGARQPSFEGGGIRATAPAPLHIAPDEVAPEPAAGTSAVAAQDVPAAQPGRSAGGSASAQSGRPSPEAPDSVDRDQAAAGSGDDDDEPLAFADALERDELYVAPPKPVAIPFPAGPAALPRRPTFAEFSAVVNDFVREAGPGMVAELSFLQLARRRDMSSADCEAAIKMLAPTGRAPPSRFARPFAPS